MTRGPRGAVFLLTDYGSEDEFAGLTRAVVLREAPEAPVVDLTHGVPPFDVRAGALSLSRSVVHLGPGVVVAVVDPGVGSGRRAVAVAVRGAGRREGAGRRGPAGPGILVGPDNGLLGWAVDALGGPAAAVALPRPRGSTGGGSFDGRDLFAPVAARLWRGASLNDVGLPVDPRSLQVLAPPRLEVTASSIETEVLWVDRFGNVQLAARADDADRAGLGDAVTVTSSESGAGRAGGPEKVGRRVASFSALGADEVGLMVDANGQLSLVCPRRSAATVLAVRAGDIVHLRPARS